MYYAIGCEKSIRSLCQDFPSLSTDWGVDWGIIPPGTGCLVISVVSLFAPDLFATMRCSDFWYIYSKDTTLGTSIAKARAVVRDRNWVKKSTWIEIESERSYGLVTWGPTENSYLLCIVVLPAPSPLPKAANLIWYDVTLLCANLLLEVEVMNQFEFDNYAEQYWIQSDYRISEFFSAIRPNWVTMLYSTVYNMKYIGFSITLNFEKNVVMKKVIYLQWLTTLF